MKKVRMIVPALAIVLGVGGALVTNASPKVFAPILVSDLPDCDPVGTCDPDIKNEMCSTTQHPVLNQIQTDCTIPQEDGRFVPIAP